MTADKPTAEAVAALTDTELDALGCRCPRNDGDFWHHTFCWVPAVERILAARASTTQDEGAGEVERQAWEGGVRQAMAWLRADYEYGTGPEWRENGAEWIADRLAEHTADLRAVVDRAKGGA